MIIYRPDKLGLLEALAGAKEFNTFEEMKEYVFQYFNEMYKYIGIELPFSIEDIVIKDEISDDWRCGWHDTRCVCVNQMVDDSCYQLNCVGMCATDYEKLTPEEVSERINNMWKNRTDTVIMPCPCLFDL